MKLHFLNDSLHLLIILPLIFLMMKEHTKQAWRKLSVFIFFYLSYSFLLVLPIHFQQFKFINGSWNWTGKIFGILASLAFMFFYLKKYPHKNFLTLKQQKDSQKLSIKPYS
jgi:uncharacterized protein